jgi:hypothetical protein
MTYPRLYENCSKGIGCEQVQLKSNNEFESYLDFHMIGRHIYTGKWEENNDTIILNSYLQPQDALVKVVERREANTGTIIKLKSYPYVSVKNGNDTVLINPVNDEVVFTKKTDSFSFVFFSAYNLKAYPIKYQVKDKDANFFEVTFQEIQIGSVLTDRKYIYKKRKLLCLPSKYALHKVNIDKKRW